MKGSKGRSPVTTYGKCKLLLGNLNVGVLLSCHVMLYNVFLTLEYVDESFK